ncbi:MAG: prepilin-type N-terminal cleavage/methylation domain-containing protein [Planctomycetota bacterium]|nr:prepilin-type N-terminal cleavage/methylation domain-containing protein [Planctomycetota bacterium]
MRKRTGFTLIELLVVMAIIALLLGLLLPALAKARATARQVKSGTQLNQIYKGKLVWTVDNNEDSLPTPGLINRVGNRPGRGKEDLKQNTHDNHYASLVTAEYFNTNILIDPSEASGNVIANPIYDIERYSPQNDVYWDDGQESGGLSVMKTDLGETCHTSYATSVLCGSRKNRNWSNRLNSRFALIGNRGVEDSNYDDDVYLSSKTLLIHGGRKNWVGNTCYGDGHTELHNGFFPETLAQIPQGGSNLDDGLFSLEDQDAPAPPGSSGDAGLYGSDVYLCVTNGGSATSGDSNADSDEYQHRATWD